MAKAKNLAATLAASVGLGEKKASLFATGVAESTIDSKLQELVGVPQDAISTFTQRDPGSGHATMANPLTPLNGDEIFFSGLMPGARMMAHDGTWWDIEDYDFEGKVTIVNPWYPNGMHGIVSVQDIRRSIYAWIEPFTQIVPPPPAGVDYGTIEVKQAD